MEKSITSPTRHSWKIITRFSRTTRYISSKNKQMNLTLSHPYCLSSQLPRWFICVVTKVLLKHIPKHPAVYDKMHYCNLAKELLHDLMNTLAIRNSTFWKNAWNTVHNFTSRNLSLPTIEGIEISLPNLYPKHLSYKLQGTIQEPGRGPTHHHKLSSSVARHEALNQITRFWNYISTKLHNNIHRILYFETFLTKKIK